MNLLLSCFLYQLYHLKDAPKCRFCCEFLCSRSQSRQSAKLFLQSSELGLPQPPTHMRVCPPHPVLGGGAHSLAGEGVGVSQFRRGDRHCGTHYIYVLCVLGISVVQVLQKFRSMSCAWLRSIGVSVHGSVFQILNIYYLTRGAHFVTLSSFCFCLPLVIDKEREVACKLLLTNSILTSIFCNTEYTEKNETAA